MKNTLPCISVLPGGNYSSHQYSSFILLFRLSLNCAPPSILQFIYSDASPSWAEPSPPLFTVKRTKKPKEKKFSIFFYFHSITPAFLLGLLDLRSPFFPPPLSFPFCNQKKSLDFAVPRRGYFIDFALDCLEYSSRVKLSPKNS